MVVPVTVLMAVWNPPLDFLQQAVDSVLGQTCREFEFLIIDDGSTDPDLAPSLARFAADDARVRVIHEPHRGLTKSLNRGLALANGELIARQDADDWSEPERLALQRAYFRRHPETVLCGAMAWTHQESGRRLWRTRLPLASEDIAHALARGNPFVHGSTMFRQRAACEIGGYSEDLRCSQDYDFFWRLSEQGRAVNLDKALYHYRFAAGSVSAGRAAEQALAHRAARLLAQARLNGDALSTQEALGRAGLEIEGCGDAYRSLLKQADHLMLAGAYGRAGRAYLDSIQRHPVSALAWGKLLRMGVFWAVPGAREACFR